MTTTDALEAEVSGIRDILHASGGGRPGPRGRMAMDRHYARLLRLLAPRIRHFIRAYGLVDMEDDARQACALGVWRAIEAYDPARARFTTFVNWQLRGELQSLRFRVRTDAREPARRLGARTVSLDALSPADEARLEDAEALARTEAGAADMLARRACTRLLDEHFAHMRGLSLRQRGRQAVPPGPAWTKPGTLPPGDIARIEARLDRERAVLAAHLLGEDEAGQGPGLSAEQRRQVAQRGMAALAERARGNPRFDPDAAPMTLPPMGRRH